MTNTATFIAAVKNTVTQDYIARMQSMNSPTEAHRKAYADLKKLLQAEIELVNSVMVVNQEGKGQTLSFQEARRIFWQMLEGQGVDPTYKAWSDHIFENVAPSLSLEEVITDLNLPLDVKVNSRAFGLDRTVLSVVVSRQINATQLVAGDEDHILPTMVTVNSADFQKFLEKELPNRKQEKEALYRNHFSDIQKLGFRAIRGKALQDLDKILLDKMKELLSSEARATDDSEESAQLAQLEAKTITSITADLDRHPDYKLEETKSKKSGSSLFGSAAALFKKRNAQEQYHHRIVKLAVLEAMYQFIKSFETYEEPELFQEGLEALAKFNASGNLEDLPTMVQTRLSRMMGGSADNFGPTIKQLQKWLGAWDKSQDLEKFLNGQMKAPGVLTQLIGMGTTLQDKTQFVDFPDVVKGTIIVPQEEKKNYKAAVNTMLTCYAKEFNVVQKKRLVDQAAGKPFQSYDDARREVLGSLEKKDTQSFYYKGFSDMLEEKLLRRLVLQKMTRSLGIPGDVLFESVAEFIGADPQYGVALNNLGLASAVISQKGDDTINPITAHVMQEIGLPQFIDRVMQTPRAQHMEKQFWAAAATLQDGGMQLNNEQPINQIMFESMKREAVIGLERIAQEKRSELRPYKQAYPAEVIKSAHGKIFAGLDKAAASAKSADKSKTYRTNEDWVRGVFKLAIAQAALNAIEAAPNMKELRAILEDTRALNESGIIPSTGTLRTALAKVYEGTGVDIDQLGKNWKKSGDFHQFLLEGNGPNHPGILAKIDGALVHMQAQLHTEESEGESEGRHRHFH